MPRWSSATSKRLGFDAGERARGGCPATRQRGIAVDIETGDRAAQPALRADRATPRSARVSSARCSSVSSQRGGERDDAGDVLGAGAQTTLVTAAFDERHERASVRARRARRHPSARRTCGPRSRRGRRARCGTPRSSHCGACTASVCSTASRRVLAHERRDLVERLDDARLVVDEHHRDDRGAFVERGGERVEVDDARRRRAPTRARRGSPRAPSRAAAPSTALCSIPVVTTPSSPRRARAAQAAPLIARLSASLPPPVKTISAGSAPSAPRRPPRAPPRAPSS